LIVTYREQETDRGMALPEKEIYWKRLRFFSLSSYWLALLLRQLTRQAVPATLTEERLRKKKGRCNNS
jgi:hypothetical protein